MDTSDISKKWPLESIVDLIQDGIVPDFWDDSMVVTYGLLQQIVDYCCQQGRILKYVLPEVLGTIKPHVDMTKMPQVCTIKTQIKRKKNLAHPENPVPWLEIQDSDFIGPACQFEGIRVKDLTNMNTFQDRRIVSNKVILELRLHMNRTGSTWKDVAQWLLNLKITSDLLAPNLVHRMLTSLYEKKVKLGKSKKVQEIQLLLSEEFTLPETQQPNPFKQLTGKLQRQVRSNEKLQIQCTDLKDQVICEKETNTLLLEELVELDAELDSLLNTLSEAEEEKDKLINQLDRVQNEYDKCMSKLTVLQKKESSLNPHNVRRREDRKKKAIQILKQTINEVNMENAELKSKEHVLEEKLEATKSSVISLKKQLYYNKRKSINWKQAVDMQKVDLHTLQIQLKEKEMELQKAKEQMEDVLLDKLPVEIKIDGKYSNELRSTIMELHSLGLSTHNMENVIRVISERLFNTELPKLPCRSTVKQFILESNILGKIQVGRSLLEETNNTLHVDGTTDHQHHYFGFQVSNRSSSLTMGMVETDCGDTTTQIKTLQGILDDCVEVVASGDTDKAEKYDNMLVSLKNTMTDQSSVNKAFKKELENLREVALEKTITNWEELTDQEKNSHINVNQFFCLLHVLLGIADAFELALREYEAILTSDGTKSLGRYNMPEMTRKDMSCCGEAIKAASSLFSSLGHPSAGVPQDFQSYLQLTGDKCHFQRFQHTRFNIFGENAVAYIYHLSHIKEFLDKSQQDNQLVRAVRADTKDDILIALIMSQALMHKYVTAPLHSLILNTNHASHILDMNIPLLDLQTGLENLSSNPNQILDNAFQISSHLQPVQKGIFLSVNAMPDGDHIDLIMECLSLMATAAVVTFTRQVKHQLPQGNLSTDTETLREQTLSVPKSNAIGESQFALLKYLRAFKPNASISHMEATLLWAYNKTGHWLMEKSEEEREKLFATARAKTPEFKKIWKMRQIKLTKARQDKIMNQKAKTLEKERKKSALKQKVIDDISTHGGQCRTPDDVDTMCQECTTRKEETAALKRQLSFYKQIVKPASVKPQLFFVTSKGKPIPNTKLKQNLKHIIQEHLGLTGNPSTSEEPLVPDIEQRSSRLKEVKKTILCDYSSVFTPGTGMSRRRKRPAPMPDLVGKRIRHQWILEGTRVKRWYTGKVLQRRDGINDEESSMVQFDQFDVQYDGESNIYTLDLERDWFRGELELENAAEGGEC